MVGPCAATGAVSFQVDWLISRNNTAMPMKFTPGGRLITSVSFCPGASRYWVEPLSSSVPSAVLSLPLSV